MLENVSDYIIDLDNLTINMINNSVAEKGIEKYLSQQLIYLDCTRIYNSGMRAMQTIGYPYRRELSAYLYVLNNYDISKEDTNNYINALLELHNKNLEFEKDNPPIWYDKKHKNRWGKKNKDKLPRKRKYVEQSIPGLTGSERLKQRTAEFGKLTFKLNKHKDG